MPFDHGEFFVGALEDLLEGLMGGFPDVDGVVHVDGRDEVLARAGEGDVIPGQPVDDVLVLGFVDEVEVVPVEVFAGRVEAGRESERADDFVGGVDGDVAAVLWFEADVDDETVADTR